MRTAFAVGQARGAVLLSAGLAGVPCYSYTPQAVKQAVCGSGGAAKDQVQRMVGALLSLAEPPRRRSCRRRPGGGDLPRERQLAAGGGRVIASVRGPVLVGGPTTSSSSAAVSATALAVSAETLRSVPGTGTETQLHTHLVMRDDGMQLFGFAAEEERDLFLMLVQVQGVGPKVALAVLSGGRPASS